MVAQGSTIPTRKVNWNMALVRPYPVYDPYGITRAGLATDPAAAIRRDIGARLRIETGIGRATADHGRNVRMYRRPDAVGFAHGMTAQGRVSRGGRVIGQDDTRRGCPFFPGQAGSETLRRDTSRHGCRGSRHARAGLVRLMRAASQRHENHACGV